MGVRKRHNKWWVDFSFNGNRCRKPSPENSRKGAQAYELFLKQRLARGMPLYDEDEKKKRIIFSEFAEHWIRDYVEVNNRRSEIQTKKRILRVHLIPFFNNFTLDKITNLHVEQFKALKMREEKSNKSINNYLGVLRRLLNTAEEWEFLDRVPKIKPLKVMPCSTDYLTPAECEKLLAGADGVWKDMIYLAIKTGLRFGEIVALTWEDVDFDNSHIAVRHSIVADIPQESTKSNKIRYVPMIKELKLMLLRRKAVSNGEYIFARDRNFLKRESSRRNLLRACERAGIRQIGWHKLRHTFASHLAEKGVSPLTIKELLGHSDIKTTMRYAHLGPLALKEAIRVLE